MIVYGTKAKQLAKEALTDKCPNCGTQNSLDMYVFQKYAHLFWIPFMPIGKTGVSQCSHCKQVLKQKEMPTQLKAAYDNVKAQTKTPVWTFIGLALVVVLITSAIIGDKNKNAQNAKLIEAPHKGDVFEVRTPDRQYTLIKVEEVKSDTIYVREHIYTTNKISGLYDLKRKGDTGYLEEVTAFDKKELKSMFDKGDIINIIR
jgi:hypothetical protein